MRRAVRPRAARAAGSPRGSSRVARAVIEGSQVREHDSAVSASPESWSRRGQESKGHRGTVLDLRADEADHGTKPCGPCSHREGSGMLVETILRAKGGAVATIEPDDLARMAA